jgi:hypothetical protein
LLQTIYKTSPSKALVRASIIGVLFSFCVASIAEGGDRRFSSLEGTTIRMQPSGASFQIPADWTHSSNTLHLTSAELEKVRKGTGEWDTEYAKVVNAGLPFEDCAVHAGGEGWGANGASFGDLQMRGYVSRRNGAEIERRIAGRGFSAARNLPSKNASGAVIHEDDEGAWHRIAISYDLSYSDYGGKANVEFYISVHGNWTVVLVFMHADTGKQDSTIRQIVQSFSWQ